MLADSPSLYLREDECMQFLAAVPTVWDETRVLHARIGDYLVLARRSGREWYLGAMTDWTPREFEIPLAFLGTGPWRAHIWQDGVNAARCAIDYKARTVDVDGRGKLTIKMAPGGGWVARLVPPGIAPVYPFGPVVGAPREQYKRVGRQPHQKGDRTMWTRFAAALLCAAALAGAQSQNFAWLNDNSPSLGGGNCFPWGQEGLRYQVIVPNNILGNKRCLIQDLYFAGYNRDALLGYGDVEIRMGLTTQQTPAASWTTNNPNPHGGLSGPPAGPLPDQAVDAPRPPPELRLQPILAGGQPLRGDHRLEGGGQGRLVGPPVLLPHDRHQRLAGRRHSPGGPGRLGTERGPRQHEPRPGSTATGA